MSNPFVGVLVIKRKKRGVCMRWLVLMEASMLIGLRIGLQGVFKNRIRVCYRDLFLQSQATSGKLREKNSHKLSCIFIGAQMRLLQASHGS